MLAYAGLSHLKIRVHLLTMRPTDDNVRATLTAQDVHLWDKDWLLDRVLTANVAAFVRRMYSQ